MPLDTTCSYYSSSSLGRRTMPSSHRFRPMSNMSSGLHGRYSKPDLSATTMYDAGSSPSLSLYLPPKTGSPSAFQSSRCSSSSQYYTADCPTPMSPAMSRRDNIIRSLVRTSNDLTKHHFLSPESVSMMTGSHDIHTQSTRNHIPLRSVNKTSFRSITRDSPIAPSKTVLSGPPRSLSNREVSIRNLYRPVVIERPSLQNYLTRPREDKPKLQLRPITRDRPLIKFLERDDLDPSEVRSLLNSWARGERLDDEFSEDRNSHKRDSVRSNDSGIGSFRGSRRSRQKSGEASSDSITSNYNNKENEILHSNDQKSLFYNDRAPSVDEGVHLDNEDNSNLSGSLNTFDNPVPIADKKFPQTNETSSGADETFMTKRRVRINSDKYVLPNEKTTFTDGKTDILCSTNSGIEVISVKKRVRTAKSDESTLIFSKDAYKEKEDQKCSSIIGENVSKEGLFSQKDKAETHDSDFSRIMRNQTNSEQETESIFCEKVQNTAINIEFLNIKEAAVRKEDEMKIEQLRTLQTFPSSISTSASKQGVEETGNPLEKEDLEKYIFNNQIQEAKVMPQLISNEKANDSRKLPMEEAYAKEKNSAKNADTNDVEEEIASVFKSDIGESNLRKDAKILSTGTKQKVKKKKNIIKRNEEPILTQCVEKQAEETKAESIPVNVSSGQFTKTSVPVKNLQVGEVKISDSKICTQSKKTSANDQGDENTITKNDEMKTLSTSQEDSNLSHQEDLSTSATLPPSKGIPTGLSNADKVSRSSVKESVDGSTNTQKFINMNNINGECEKTNKKEKDEISSIRKSRSSDYCGSPKENLEFTKIKSFSLSGASNLDISKKKTAKPEKNSDNIKKNCLQNISDEKTKSLPNECEGNKLRRSTTTSLTTDRYEGHHKLQKSSTLNDVGTSSKLQISEIQKPPLSFSPTKKTAKKQTKENIPLDLPKELNLQKNPDSQTLTSQLSDAYEKSSVGNGIKLDSIQKENIYKEENNLNSVVSVPENAPNWTCIPTETLTKECICKTLDNTCNIQRENQNIPNLESGDISEIMTRNDQIESILPLSNEKNCLKQENKIQISKTKKKNDNKPENHVERKLAIDNTVSNNCTRKTECTKPIITSEKLKKTALQLNITDTSYQNEHSSNEHVVEIREETDIPESKQNFKKLDERESSAYLKTTGSSEHEAKTPSHFEKNRSISIEKANENSTVAGAKENETASNNKSTNAIIIKELPRKELVKVETSSGNAVSVGETKEEINKNKSFSEIFENSKEIMGQKTNLYEKDLSISPQCISKSSLVNVDNEKGIHSKTFEDANIRSKSNILNGMPACEKKTKNVVEKCKKTDNEILDKNSQVVGIRNSNDTKNQCMKGSEYSDCKMLKRVSPVVLIENTELENQLTKTLENQLTKTLENLQIVGKKDENSEVSKVSKETSHDKKVFKSDSTQFVPDVVSRNSSNYALTKENNCSLSGNKIGIETGSVEKFGEKNEINVNKGTIKNSLGDYSQSDTSEVKSDFPSETKVKKKKSLSTVECEKIKKKNQPLAEGETDKPKKKKKKKDANKQSQSKFPTITPVKKETSPVNNVGVSKPEDSPVITTETSDVDDNILKQSLDDLWEDYQNSTSNLQPSIICCSLEKNSKGYAIEDFNLLKVLGRGSYGKVMLAELKGKKQYFAIKCLKKDVVLEDNDVECTLIEKEVLAMGSSHPYLCTLFCTFQSESHLFFVMEYLSGGDLMFHIQQCGRFNQDRARFYAAEITCALKYLHAHGIIYRDAKLDNICIDSDGHVRLVDFGFCKLRIYRKECLPRNLCGTPDYMAPEILKGYHYNQSVDWWSFGVLLYEMLVGYSPFHGADEESLFWAVCNEDVIYPLFISKEAMHMLILLLNRDPEKRLGMPGCTAGDIYCQPFFRPIDWFKAERRQLEPPFKPKLNSETDVSNFDSDFTMERAALTPTAKDVIDTIDQESFFGFTYINPLMLMD